jgi:hypothetical protein
MEYLMSKKTKVTLSDMLDKVASPKSRAGVSLERAYKMHASGVADEVTALLMSSNSANGNKYTKREIKTVVKIYEDCMTKVVITKAQAKVIIEDQLMYGNNGSEVEDKE